MSWAIRCVHHVSLAHNNDDGVSQQMLWCAARKMFIALWATQHKTKQRIAHCTLKHKIFHWFAFFSLLLFLHHHRHRHRHCHHHSTCNCSLLMSMSKLDHSSTSHTQHTYLRFPLLFIAFHRRHHCRGCLFHVRAVFSHLQPRCLVTCHLFIWS